MLTLVLVTLGVAVTAQEANFAVFMHRHGDRSPTECFPTALTECAARWPDGFGQLTPRGMRMGLDLGKALRQRYNHLLPVNYSRTAIVTRSSDYDRTLQTAEAVLLGLFPPGTGPTLADGSPAVTNDRLQPVPEHTVAKNEDTLLLAYSPSACPAMAAADAEEAKVDEAQWAVVEAQWDAVKPAVAAATGLPPSRLTINAMYAVWDVAVCDIDHGFTLPAGLEGNETLLRILQETADFTLQHLFQSPRQQKLAAGRIIAEWTARLLAAEAGAVQPGWDPTSFPEPDRLADPSVMLGPRVWHYSAHDATIVALLQALQVYNGVHPPYASSVALELFNATAEQLAVRAFYNTNQTLNNGAFGPAQKLQLPCDALHTSKWLREHEGALSPGECTVGDFAQHYAAVAMPGDTWQSECGLLPSPTPEPKPPTGWSDEQAGLLGGGTAVAGLLVGMVAGPFLQRWWTNGREEARGPHDATALLV